ncbi:hypothetical protein FEM48_Zijuj03G0132500 [Ziziphus jujuba var. spinosa]|uniref:Uncharacterized protein n=1 Tax=Ziziphus jujuba var. spinosa TaxID=714518 RepID=A0A978VQI3_ZIZJJ|nr:hypothetical protein FEM48_Zijuj03G0132500 [Ziziphus jujuba var. spinosa]
MHHTILPPLLVCNEATASTCRTGFSLAFGPSKSPRYKVVCVVNSDFLNQVEIYLSEMASWRLCTVSFPSNFLRMNFNSMVATFGMVLFAGSVFWILLLLGGDHLHLICNKTSYTNFNVYEIERGYLSWFVEFRVDIDEVLIAFPQTIPLPQDFDIFDSSVVCVIRCELEEPNLVLRIINLPNELLIAMAVEATKYLLGTFLVEEGKSKLNFILAQMLYIEYLEVFDDSILWPSSTAEIVGSNAEEMNVANVFWYGEEK